MTIELAIVLSLTLMALILFITDAMPVEVVALLVLALLFLSGVLTAEEGLQGFSNEATVAIGAMFVLGEGLRQTGALERLTDRLQREFLRDYRRGLLFMMVGAGAISAFINNVAVVAVMLPVLLDLARKLDISPSRLLIPLSFAAMFGGSCTLIGTSSTLLVSGLIAERGLAPIGMFEVTGMGLMLFAVGLIYLMTLGRRLLPDRPLEGEWTERLHRADYRAQIELLPKHPAVGEVASNFFGDGEDSRVIAVFRQGDLHAEQIEDTILEAGDVLRVSTEPGGLHRLESDPNLNVLPLRTVVPDDDPRTRRDLDLFQAIISPRSALVGKTLRDANLDPHHPVLVVALRRAGEVMVHDLLEVELEGGEVLLMEAPRDELQRLQKSEDFIVVSQVKAGRYKRRLLWPVLGIFLAIVVLAGLGWAPIVQLAVAGAVAMVLLGALTAQDAYRAIDWQVIFLLGGFIPLGLALEKVGAIELVAHWLVEGLGGFGPLALLAGFYFATNLMSDLVSNQATAVLVTPVAIATALAMGVDPRPFVIAVAFAASASFASPVGYHTNVMIYGAGNYRYLDFVKVGFPLNLVFLVTAVVALPLFWSF